MFAVRHENLDEQLGGDLGLRIKAHDAHRVECVATIPLADPGKTRRYELALEMAVPEPIWREHDPWTRLFVRSRLASPRGWTAADSLRKDPTTPRHVKLQAQAGVHHLKTVAALIRRDLRGLRDDEKPLNADVADRMAGDIKSVVQATMTQVGSLGEVGGVLEKEATLAVEYLTSEVLQLAARVEAELAGIARIGATQPPIEGRTGVIRDLLKTIVDEQHTVRAKLGLMVPTTDDPDSLSDYIHRSSLLKKHFQRALFLDADVDVIERKTANWVAGIVAVLASTWAFIWNIWYLNEAIAVGTTLVSLSVAGLIAGVLYAVKDRIKDLGKRRVSTWLKRWYADRAIHLFVREPSGERGRRLGLGRETVSITWESAPDVLLDNGETGRRMRHIRIRDRLSHRGGTDLSKAGVTALKHIVRYDLSPLFAGVDDRKKPVVVMDGGDVRTVKARRQYRVPVRAQMFVDGGKLPVLERIGEAIIEGRKLRGLETGLVDEIWQDDE